MKQHVWKDYRGKAKWLSLTTRIFEKNTIFRCHGCAACVDEGGRLWTGSEIDLLIEEIRELRGIPEGRES